MSSSDSEEKNVETLKEAIDTQFINDSMFQQSKSRDENKRIIVEPKLPSLRKNSSAEDESFNFFKVSKGFQTFVAKKLSEKLDILLKELLCANLTPERVLTKPKGGIKLLKTSEKYLKVPKNKHKRIDDEQKTNFDCVTRTDCDKEIKMCLNGIVEDCEECNRRNVVEEDESYNFFKVPEDLKNQIIKFLFEILEEQIKLKKLPDKTNSANKSNLRGIKLLKTSKHYLNELDLEEKEIARKPRKRKNLETDEDLESRCKLVAVEAEDILSKKDVKSWSNRSKAEVFAYRKKKGKLVCVEPKFV